MGLFGKKWIAVRTEGGARAELIDRMEGYFKANGIKSKITQEGGSLKRIHVLKKDVDQAHSLLETFDSEN